MALAASRAARALALTTLLAFPIGCADPVAPSANAARPDATPAEISNSTFGSDDFQRMFLGSNWRGGGDVVGIVGDKDLGALKAGPISVDWAGATFTADQFSEASVASMKDPNMLVQVHVRRKTLTKARYGFHYNPERVPAAWEIKYDGVPLALTRVLATAAARAPVAGDRIRLEVRGRTLTGYLNGVAIIATTDNAPGAILTTGGTGLTARLRSGTTVPYPAPIVAAWRGGAL